MTFKIPLIILPIVISTSALADIADSQIPCTPAQQAIVTTALSEVRNGIPRAIDALAMTNQADEARFYRWFGTNADGAVDQVRGVFEQAALHVNISNIWCPLANLPELGWSANELAKYYTDGSGSIYLAPDFFSLSAGGTDSFAGVIFHELTHVEAVGNTDDNAYGISDSENLAQTDPVKARTNADNYQYFLESILFGI